MGKFIWHEHARYVSITASVYTVWAAYFGMVYRKFFWDFVSGIRRNPGGIQPAKQDAFFISIIVKAPVIPILSLLLGLSILALEYPAPFMKGTAAYRSMVVKVVLLFFPSFPWPVVLPGDKWCNMVACRYFWLYPRHYVRGSDGRSKGQQSQEGACLRLISAPGEAYDRARLGPAARK